MNDQEAPDEHRNVREAWGRRVESITCGPKDKKVLIAMTNSSVKIRSSERAL